MFAVPCHRGVAQHAVRVVEQGFHGGAAAVETQAAQRRAGQEMALGLGIGLALGVGEK